ncbi:hypothetical protein JOC85_004099 [Bacillus mesophilus]|uniref:DUF4177 domain-containing protein n=1 Tax=Bacillus mesophilus TaxID=1808955 RepID=A0A6M0QC53_9BACI|nr:hypothetical protein [Bacillus mesophilus]MBM7663228.1 hypothetical protein [Bacillus mesophilus]NEY73933.1 hypothetical protein [Bacillus mesophilus]
MVGNREIGTAWYGRHVVIIKCMPLQNQFIGMNKSLHAPTEPPSHNCAETLAQYLSIGYELISTYSVSPNEVHYVLKK